jgi:hypothetical protein
MITSRRRRTSVDDPTAAMHIVQPEENLLRNLAHEMHGHAFVLVALDEAEQIFAENFEHHAYVDAVGALVAEMVEEGDDM